MPTSSRDVKCTANATDIVELPDRSGRGTFMTDASVEQQSRMIRRTGFVMPCGGDTTSVARPAARTAATYTRAVNGRSSIVRAAPDAGER